jgi:hypothetical protein
MTLALGRGQERTKRYWLNHAGLFVSVCELCAR